MKSKAVQAGWLTVHRGGIGEETAYLTSLGERGWAQIEVGDMLESMKPPGIAERRDWITLDLAKKYSYVHRSSIRFTSDNLARFQAVSLDRSGRRATRPAADGPLRGWYVFSGRAVDPKKHVEYVFFDQQAAPPVALQRHVWETFTRLHSKPSRNAPEPDGSWKLLVDVVKRRPEAAPDAPTTVEAAAHERRIPVFFVGDPAVQGGDFTLGLTRLFKLPHDRSIGQTLPSPSHDPSKRFLPAGRDGMVRFEPDFVDMLFGYVEEPHDAQGRLRDDISMAPGDAARKGRIAFSFATMTSREAEPSKTMQAVQMGPRASYGPLYLAGRSSGWDRDYSRGDPRIAGRKRYLPRHQAAPGPTAFFEDFRKQADPHVKLASRNVVSDLVFLQPKAGATELRFRGEIRLHNVTAAELGAVLFALTHGGDPAKPYRHMLGRAKPFGAGQMRVDTARLSVRPNDAAAAALVKPPADDERVRDRGLRGFCPVSSHEATDNASHRPFLKAFVAHVEASHGGINLATHATIREFLAACSPATGAAEAAEGRLAYMALERFAEVKNQDRDRGPAGVLLPLRSAAPAMRRIWES